MSIKTIWNIYYWLQYWFKHFECRFICCFCSVFDIPILLSAKEYKVMCIFLLAVLIICLLPKLFYNIILFRLKRVLDVKPGILYKINKDNVLYEYNTNIKTSVKKDINVLILEKFNLNQKFIYKDLYCRSCIKGQIKILYDSKIYRMDIKCLLNF